MRALLQSLREEVWENIQLMSVTDDVSHDPMSWSKEEAYANMPPMLVVADTSHDPMSWSKDLA